MIQIGKLKEKKILFLNIFFTFYSYYYSLISLSFKPFLILLTNYIILITFK